MGQDNSHPQPGDLIEISRPVYQHWALYVGDGYVIHVTDEGAPSVSGSISFISAARAKVKKEPLKKVVGNDKWRVNNKYDRSHAPRPVREIIRLAESWIDKEVPYDVLGSNCEHFVTMLRYGEGVSDQVKIAGAIGCTLVGLLLLCCCWYCPRAHPGDRTADELSGRAQSKAGGSPHHSGH